MLTRREIITNKYEVLKQKISEITSKGEFLPECDDIDLADYLFMISYKFLNIHTDSQYIVTIENLMESNDCVLSDKEFKQVYPLIKEFIVWFKSLM